MGGKEINGKIKIAKILQEEVCPEYKRTFYILPVHNDPAAPTAIIVIDARFEPETTA